jgi:CrcB protein
VITLLAVLAGGFAGAVAHQVLYSAVQERAATRFPVGILVVNLSGAFALGLLYGFDVGSRWPGWLATGAEIGLIGAYTTYSTWAVDSLALTRGGAARSAVVNLVGSLAAGVLLAWAGASIGSAMLTARTQSITNRLHFLDCRRWPGTTCAWVLRARRSSWPPTPAVHVTSRDETSRCHLGLCSAGTVVPQH